MNLRVEIGDSGLRDVGFDVNGDFILEYNGLPFTGMEVDYYTNHPTQVQGETEYQNGYRKGVARTYHSNGQLESEYHKGIGGIRGPWKEWDSNGNLIYDKVWLNDKEIS